MRTLGVLTLLLLSFAVGHAQNWPQWRGPSLNGVSNEKKLRSLRFWLRIH
jgi:hypothetical protein